jgi:hypothetical protein
MIRLHDEFQFHHNGPARLRGIDDGVEGQKVCEPGVQYRKR